MRRLANILFATIVAATPLAGEDVGRVSFANSGAAAAQPDFLYGLAQLHNFEYEDAAEAFRRAQRLDPGFAFAYWGEAMTFNHPIWMQQDREAATSALARLATTREERLAKAPTARERAYLEAVEILYGGDGTKEERDRSYAAAMAQVHGSFPDDVDAAAFHALALLGTAHAGRDLPTYMRAAAILEEAADRQPDHPGVVHYLIHSYDDPIHAPLGLRAARTYARLAPAAGHAQHMTSHIFLALGMWEETVAANEAAMAAVDRVRSAQDRPPLRCGHYPSWRHYALTQQGRFGSALEALEACREEAGATAAPRSGDAEEAVRPKPESVAAAIAMQLRQVLETGDWEGDVAGWPLPEEAPSGARLDHAYLRALAAVAGGRLAEARAAHADLRQMATEIETLERDDPDPSDRRRAEILGMQVDALLHEADGAPEEAIALLREAAAAEEGLPFGFGPPVVDKPSHELLGEVLSRAGRPSEAEAAFRAGLLLARERALSLLGLARASAAAGDAEAAADAYGRLAAIWQQADRVPEDVRAALAARPARPAPGGG